MPTTLTENGRPVTFEAVVYRPEGAGPFPTLAFHHGSTGRGWLVVFPQRRGRGGSDGLYDEGFLPDRSAYSCVPATSLAGLERAKHDLDEILKYLEQRADRNFHPHFRTVSTQSLGGATSIWGASSG